jgi:hypothetical protein
VPPPVVELLVELCETSVCNELCAVSPTRRLHVFPVFDSNDSCEVPDFLSTLPPLS